jgi:hypothetical protein
MWMQRVIRAAAMDAGVGQSFDKENPAAPFFKELVLIGLTDTIRYNISNLELILEAVHNSPVAENICAAQARSEILAFVQALLKEQRGAYAYMAIDNADIRNKAADAWMRKVITSLSSFQYFHPVRLFKKLVMTGLLAEHQLDMSLSRTEAHAYNAQNLALIQNILNSHQMLIAMARDAEWIRIATEKGIYSTRMKMFKFVSKLQKQ